jgi:hypothetical protein
MEWFFATTLGRIWNTTFGEIQPPLISQPLENQKKI